MSDGCLRCGNESVLNTIITADTLINKTDNLPDIFPISIKYCDFCANALEFSSHADLRVRGEIILVPKSRPPHYHKEGWHFEFVMSGSFEYYERTLNSEEVSQKITVTSNQLLYAAPLKEHTLIFKEKVGILSITYKDRKKSDVVSVSNFKYPE